MAGLACFHPGGYPGSMEVNYSTLDEDLLSGVFRSKLEDELIRGFREMKDTGQPLPPATYYATKIAEIINAGGPVPLNKDFAFHVYQEVLLAVETARATVQEMD